MTAEGYSLAKALSWYTIGNILIKAINFLTLRVFTSVMSTSDFGIFGLFQSYLSIFEIVILIGTAHTIKMVKYDDSIDYDKYVSSILLIPLIGTVICLSAIGVYSVCANELADLEITIWYAIIVSSCLMAIVNIISSKLILEGDYKSFISYSFISSISNISISLILCYAVFYDGQAYWARIYGGIVSYVVSLAYILTRIEIIRPCISYIKMGIIMGLPLLVHAIATQILVQSDKIIISKMASFSEVGIYSVAATISVIPMTILGSIESSWSPWYFKSLDDRNYVEIRKKNDLILAGFAIAIMLFNFATPEIVKIITAKEYWDAVYVLIPLSIATFAELVYLIPLNMELYYKENNAIWIYTLSVVIFNIIVDIVGIKMFGYYAAACVTCASRFLLFAMHYLRCKGIDKNDVLSLRIVLAAIFALTSSAVICINLYDYTVIRWGAIFIVLIVLALKFPKLKARYV